ncbi:large ribosomal subunit protein bL21m [Planococcus citri]|uniref:large ribosomal subunit protein bL21m n=1 Tax=Planococcus citri TaxID=170843 RepID=UPI0031F7BD61
MLFKWSPVSRICLNFVRYKSSNWEHFRHPIRPIDKTPEPPKVPKFTNVYEPFQEVIEDNIEEERVKSKEIIKKVNDHIQDGSFGRLFAVIYILGKQYKVTAEDILIIEKNWAPKMKDSLRFEKVLLVGGANFTLIGRPILPRNIVNVTASILNKDLTHTKFRFYRIHKERVHNLNFVREELTYLRINNIEVYPQLNELSYSEYTRSM